MFANDRPSAKTTAWLDLRAVARLRASSEAPAQRIENVLSADADGGWRAAEPGAQLIEVRFDSPRDVARIRLEFVEDERPRTQQFTIRWSSRRGDTHGELVRQQFNFSPSGATREIEDYRVHLRDVETLQIEVIPDIGDRLAVATLARLQLG